jgi:hypothetical protein
MYGNGCNVLETTAQYVTELPERRAWEPQGSPLTRLADGETLVCLLSNSWQTKQFQCNCCLLRLTC